MSRLAPSTVLAIAVVVAAIGIWRGTSAVGGSDSSCYALMAAAFARGDLQPVSALADAPWPDASRTFAPGGFVPSPVAPNAASPVCAPGFAVLLAPLYAIGGRDAIFLLTPVAGSILVLATYAAGRRIAGAVAGVAAALLVAATPVFVFQLVQPMNDVTTAALWMAVVALAMREEDRSGGVGALTGLALLVRPNLAPAAAVVAVWSAAAHGRGAALRFAAGVAPFGATALALNAALYGDPFQSGYGPAENLFSTAHLVPNVGNYGRALLQTQLGFPLLGVLALVAVPPDKRRMASLPLGVAAAICAVYLLYRPFPEWWYLRFFLPALPMMTVLAVAVIASRVNARVAPMIAAVALVGVMVRTAAMDEALNLHRLEARFRTLGAVARVRIPEHAVYLSVWNSGSLRYHADREAIVWDSLDPAWLDRTLAWLSARNLEPYIVVEDWEEPIFRQRFAADSAFGDLDWPPRFRIERRIRVFRPADRRRYFNGEQVRTEVVMTPRSR